MSKYFKLTVGVKGTDGTKHKELPIYLGGADVEKIYTEEKSTAGLYSWFARVIAASVGSIGTEQIASKFLAGQENGEPIPNTVLQIPIVDSGNLLLQIQRECWQDIIKDQQTLCKHCGDAIVIPETDLKKIPIPDISEDFEEIVVDLGEEYVISAGKVEALKDFDGQKYNRMVFRIPLLNDAIRHEKIASDETLFWRKIAFDCLTSLYLQKGEEKEFVSEGYISRRSMLIFNKDLHTKSLKKVREALQSQLPSAKMYYEDTCPCPRRKTIPFFVAPSDFFT